MSSRTPSKGAGWFEQFAEAGRYRLLVAERDREVLGYAGTPYFRPQAPYDTTVETTIHCAPEATGQSIGRRLYAALFAALTNEDVRSIVAGFTLPNPASAKLHEQIRFQTVGVFTEVGRKFGRDGRWLDTAPSASRIEQSMTLADEAPRASSF